MTITGKAILLGGSILLALLGRKKPARAEPAAPEPPVTTIDPPMPVVPPPPPPDPAEPAPCSCEAPYLYGRWTQCDCGPYAVGAVDSWGDYQALYAKDDGRLLAVVTEDSYQESGSVDGGDLTVSAIVIGVPDPSGELIVDPTHMYSVPSFATRFEG